MKYLDPGENLVEMHSEGHTWPDFHWTETPIQRNGQTQQPDSLHPSHTLIPEGVS